MAATWGGNEPVALRDWFRRTPLDERVRGGVPFVALDAARGWRHEHLWLQARALAEFGVAAIVVLALFVCFSYAWSVGSWFVASREGFRTERG